MKRNLLFMCVIALGCAGEDAAQETTESSASAPTTAAAPAAAPSPARDACALFTAEEIKAATGVDGAGTPSQSGGADVCTWIGGGGGAIVQLFQSSSGYTSSRSTLEDFFKAKAEPISGIGDAAFYVDGAAQNPPFATIATQQGGKSAIAQIMGGEDRKNRSVALAKLSLTKL